MRRITLCQADNTAFRRPHVHSQCYRMFINLGMQRSEHSYTVNKEGKGPAWGNSLFEDNAEFGLGMAISVNARRNELRSAAQRLADVVGAPAKEWLDVMDDASKAGKAGDAFAAACRSSCSHQ